MSLKLSVETKPMAGGVTVAAEVRHGPGGMWYRSEIDIVEPMHALDLPNALRLLGDELESNIRKGSANP